MIIVAITACPTGIAHTYMAAEGLRKAAKGMGHIIKVETQGSIGIENKINAKEIAEADLVIFAVDVSVCEEYRFRNKPIYRCESNKAIKNAKAVVEEAVKILSNKL